MSDFAENNAVETVAEELVRLRAELHMLDSIIENSKDGFFITDGEARVLKVNRAYEELAGMKREDILGKHMSQLENVYISHSASLIVKEVRRAITIEQYYLRTGRSAYITSTPVFNRDGEIILIVTNNRDFSEISALRDELARSRELAASLEGRFDALHAQLYERSLIVAKDKKTLEVLRSIEAVAKSDVTLLITGEPGAGKEQYARFVHENSTRSHSPFLKVSCAAIPPEEVEDALFGYESAASEAENATKLGFLEVARGGTLFFDEVSALSLPIQERLLQAMQSRTIQRSGKAVAFDVRVIASTREDLLAAVQNGAFLEALYYLLHVVRIEVPALRERPEDIIPLSRHFLTRCNRKYEVTKTFSPTALSLLESFPWYGNARELRIIIEKLHVMTDGALIGSDDVRMTIGEEKDKEQVNSFSLKQRLAELEHEYIQKAYAEKGTLQQAADSLGMNLTTYSRRKKQLETVFGV